VNVLMIYFIDDAMSFIQSITSLFRMLNALMVLGT